MTIIKLLKMIEIWKQEGTEIMIMIRVMKTINMSKIQKIQKYREIIMKAIRTHTSK